MAENRTAKVIVTLEPTVARALETAASASGPEQRRVTNSSYIRAIIINHLKDIGLLTQGMIESISV